MENHQPSSFYLSLSSLEQAYWHRLHELFLLVQPQQPEKGIKTLILRARAQAAEQGISLEVALQAVFTGASERTHNRVALLRQCTLRQPDSPS